ncbi:alpha/beta fold hydrolase [Kordiimonas aestuarii]|uniref:alpha/beta fold hydrolase n=1 Tax=Kordiimonas aestuarii TaxID=1005925 RepID=UPI0021CE7792|nr:alpha/beta hydrolase [Kordiimonas aestuarii]
MQDFFWRSHDGLKLHAAEHLPASTPTGLPIICVPGLTRNSRDFSDFAPWATGLGHRVLAISLRGRGLSDRDSKPRRYRPTIYARDVIGLLDATGIDQAVFVGTSLGGLVTMETAKQAGDRVAAAILNDIGPTVERGGLDRIASYAGSAAPVTDWQSAVAHCRHINGIAFPDFQEADWQRLARWTFREGPDGAPVTDYDRAIFRPAPAWALPIMEWLLWRRFRHLATGRPVLALRGALSDILSSATLAAMRNAGPLVTTAEVPRVGHAPTLAEPEARSAMQAFLTRLSGI